MDGIRKSSLGMLLASLFSISCCSAERSANHFNALAVEPGAKPDEVVRALGIAPGMAIADIGAGGGYFTVRFARDTGPAVVVFAVDINREFLDIISQTAASEQLRNVKTVHATPDDPGLPAHGVDLIFMRNVFHHIEHPVAYFRRLAGCLRPGGRIAIIDYRPGSLRTLFHSVPEERIITILREAGYRIAARHEFLERQSFTVFMVDGNTVRR
ncbi:MAG TPA: class I SAM-dependent methyltransferase [Spirochaetota bacterium]|nr:class I SAM-dependent methyltransferase [Spirochaetota bacterium]